jgi:hypothetical protein
MVLFNVKERIKNPKKFFSLIFLNKKEVNYFVLFILFQNVLIWCLIKLRVTAKAKLIRHALYQQKISVIKNPTIM